MKKFEEQVRKFDLRLELDRVTGIAEEDNFFAVKTNSESILKAKCLILAQGKRPLEARGAGRGAVHGTGSPSARPVTAPSSRQRRWPWWAEATRHFRLLSN